MPCSRVSEIWSGTRGPMTLGGDKHRVARVPRLVPCYRTKPPSRTEKGHPSPTSPMLFHDRQPLLCESRLRRVALFCQLGTPKCRHCGGRTCRLTAQLQQRLLLVRCSIRVRTAARDLYGGAVDAGKHTAAQATKCADVPQPLQLPLLYIHPSRCPVCDLRFTFHDGPVAIWPD